MTCGQIIELLEKFFPSTVALPWDNVGLLVGRRDKEVSKILLALDATDEVMEQTVREGVELLITHHPLIFTGRKTITADDFTGRRLMRLIQHDISYYAMHTNFDICKMSTLLAEHLQLKETADLDTNTYENKIGEGLGRIGELPERMNLKELADYVKKCLQLPYVIVSGDLAEKHSRVAVVPGSGKDMIKSAIQSGASVLITGDIGHHAAIDARAAGLSIIDAGHYGTEKIFTEYINRFLQQNCPEMSIGIAEECNPFIIV